ncbi:MAG: hypothetical protein VKO64_10880 [Candidatus Sericytochromatia bacterium]|nr:hypothetical protein [Candidatus Sericytochromatia bacterium]
MSQKKLYVAAIVAGTAALAGCDLSGGLPSGTIATATPTPAPNASATPIAFAGFPSNATLTGRVTFNGGAPGVIDLEYKTPGGNRSPVTAKTDANGYFSWDNIAEGTAVQVIWDDGNKSAVTTSDFNVPGIFVSDAVQAKASPDKMNPMVKMDIQWQPNPSPAIGTSANGTFGFSAVIANLDAKYQVSIFGTDKKAKFTVDIPSGATSVNLSGNSNYIGLPTGDYFYQIKFFKNDSSASFGGSNFYGSTKYIPFKK